jgi:hypothetical protein
MCARCKCALELIPDAQPEPRAACPQCGEGDTVENIQREVGEYVKEQTAQAMIKDIANGVRGSKYLKFTSNFHPNGRHRFVVDLELH